MTRQLATVEQIEKARALGAILPPTSWDVEFPTGGKVIATWTDSKGRRQYAYSAEAIAERNAKKFAEMLPFAESLPNLRCAVASDLCSASPTTRACAAIVALMDQTAMRIGSAEYASENGTYGASSLLKSHIGLDGDVVTMTFVGKHHKSHTKTATGRDLANAIRSFLSTEGDKLFPVTETQVRAYLSRFGATPKMFRTFHATRLAQELLQSMGAAADEKTAKKNIASAVKQVSEFLGNTPAMARGSYIDPAILADYAGGC